MNAYTSVIFSLYIWILEVSAIKKLKRSARIVEMTQYLLSRPQLLIPLTTFAERYQSAKSSISEDLTIIKEVFEQGHIGELHTHAGATGGVKYIPKMSKSDSMICMEHLCKLLQQPERILPGGYLYMSDIMGLPKYLHEMGRTLASAYANQDIDAIITVETKGIPIAFATAAYLNVPVVIVRRDSMVTEGSAVSINYVSGSSKQIQTMSLSRRALKEQSKILIIDDFMRVGGTIQGMIDLMEEFNAHVVGIGVFMDSREADDRLVDNYISLVTLKGIDAKTKQVIVEPGTYFKS
jgi:purine operon repressor